MNLSKNQIIVIGAIGLIVLFFVLLFLGVIPGLKNPAPVAISELSAAGVKPSLISGESRTTITT